MTAQHFTPDLFDAPVTPIARKRDPVTSKMAALHTEKATRITDKQLMYDLIFENPGYTSAEYSAMLRDRGMPDDKADRMPTKRISDLWKDQRLIKGRIRKCTVTGHNAQTYYARPD